MVQRIDSDWQTGFVNVVFCSLDAYFQCVIYKIMFCFVLERAFFFSSLDVPFFYLVIVLIAQRIQNCVESKSQHVILSINLDLESLSM